LNAFLSVAIRVTGSVGRTIQFLGAICIFFCCKMRANVPVPYGRCDFGVTTLLALRIIGVIHYSMFSWRSSYTGACGEEASLAARDCSTAGDQEVPEVH